MSQIEERCKAGFTSLMQKRKNSSQKNKHLSIECRQTNTLVTVTFSQIKEISASQLELEVKQEHCLRRGKTQVNKSRVVLVLPLIGRKGKVVFSEQLRYEVKETIAIANNFGQPRYWKNELHNLATLDSPTTLRHECRFEILHRLPLDWNWILINVPCNHQKSTFPHLQTNTNNSTELQWKCSWHQSVGHIEVRPSDGHL